MSANKNKGSEDSPIERPIITKRYRHRKYTRAVGVKINVNGDIQNINFEYGRDLGEKGKIFGFFDTNDEDLQRAIEKNPKFRVEWVLEEEWDANARRKEELEKKLADDKRKKDPYIDWDVQNDISTVNAAKTYLMEKYDATAADVNGQEKVKNFADSKRVKFPKVYNN